MPPRNMQVDVQTDEIVFRHLRECGAVKTASSEEQTECQDMGGNGFSVGTSQQALVHRPHDAALISLIVIFAAGQALAPSLA